VVLLGRNDWYVWYCIYIVVYPRLYHLSLLFDLLNVQVYAMPRSLELQKYTMCKKFVVVGEMRYIPISSPCFPFNILSRSKSKYVVISIIA